MQGRKKKCHMFCATAWRGKNRTRSSLRSVSRGRRATRVLLFAWLCQRISTSGFHEALAALLGPKVAGLSPATISRLKVN